MKHLKTLLAGIIAALALVVAAPSANAQLSKSDLREGIALLNQQLPMEVAEGASITKITLNDDATLMTIIFKLVPSKMGITLAEAKAEVSEMSAADMRGFIGDDLDELFATFGCDVDIVISFPDKTSQTFHMKR